MRLYFSSMAHPKRLAKRLSKAIEEPLAHCQQAVAGMFGYKDWHELEAVSGRHPPSKPDYLLSDEVVMSRRDFQVAMLEDVFPEIAFTDDPYAIIGDLAPSATMPWSGSFDGVANDVFPPQWSCEIGPGIFEFNVGRVGDDELRSIISSAKIHEGDLAAVKASFDSSNGIRVFTLDCHGRLFPDIVDGKSPLYLFLRLYPVISEGIIFSVSIELSASTASAFLDADDIKNIGNGLMNYFMQSAIMPGHVGPYSGCSLGVNFVLTGQATSPAIAAIMAELDRRLMSHKDEWFDSRGDYVSDIMCLPVRDIANHISEHFDAGAVEEQILANSMIKAADDMKLLSLFMRDAPENLAAFLEGHGYVEHAEFARTTSIQPDHLKQWCAFVRGMEKAGCISPAASCAFRHFFVDINTDPVLPEDIDIDNFSPIDPAIYIKAANKIGDTHLAEEYAEHGVEAIMDLAQAGWIELGIVEAP